MGYMYSKLVLWVYRHEFDSGMFDPQSETAKRKNIKYGKFKRGKGISKA